MKSEGIVLNVFSHRPVASVLCSVVMALALLTLDACKSDSGDPGPAQAGCSIVFQTNTGSGSETSTLKYTYIAKFGYTYDEKGNQTANTVKYDYTYNDGTTATYSGSTSNQYDAEGFLLRRVSQTNRTERNMSPSFSTYTAEFTYENQRLTKQTSENTSDGGPKQVYTYLYEYNSDGNLSKFTDVNSNLVTTVTYNGSAIQKVTKIDSKGTSSFPFFEYNSKGLLTKWIETNSGYTEEYRYEYDANGQVTRQERYINGKANSAYTTEYDTKSSPYAKQYPNPKGHPTIPSHYADVLNKNNMTRVMYYGPDAGGTGWDLNSSSVYTYDYNASGFPVAVTINAFDKNGTAKSTSTSAYQYQDCQ
ncbi:hypothetical protein [Chryseolinea lacunae]|uniref:YD repeat-containing protein n=1 Tax=Chryseolinea lacunae TaxID=2801331 RepID=A0ABS1KZ13_9BACT|nr:hypothetical protein [Chryseolinea lacunae]MBL0744708.1 hypothetical protein [Chryseolinea lacunae]